VPIANEVFAPTAQEVEWARRTDEAYRAAEAAGTGAIGVDGALVDAAHMRHVATILRRAERSAGRM
jgi:citrate lyase subunit beta/citryl-CoA lyase